MIEFHYSARCKCPYCGYIMWSGRGLGNIYTPNVVCLPECGQGYIEDNVVIVGEPITDEEMMPAVMRDYFLSEGEDIVLIKE